MRTRRALLVLIFACAGVLSGLGCGAPPGPASPAPAASTSRPSASAPPASPSAVPSASASAATSAKPGHGLLSVHTQPPGAMVIIEGGVLAQTPVERIDIEAGKHQMIIALPGYETVAATVTVVAGEHVVQEVMLPRADAGSRPAPGGGGDSGCSSSTCQRDCFQQHFHCENDCGYCTDCSSPVEGSALQCSVCLSCKETCRQLQKACERSCESCD